MDVDASNHFDMGDSGIVDVDVSEPGADHGNTDDGSSPQADVIEETKPGK